MTGVPDKIILGIDPGTNLLGFGIIRVTAGSPEYVDMGILDLRKEKDAYSKLKAIYDCISEVCKTYSPTEMALESPFYGKNAQVILKLGRAQGAAMMAGLQFGIEVFEYAPRRAKEAIVGSGAASKEQVKAMLERTLKADLSSKHLDATDALAIALCHFYELKTLSVSGGGKPSAGRKSSGAAWERFVKENPHRVK